MYRDEIVDEVRAVRERVLREAGGSLDALVARLRKLEERETETVLQPPPQAPTHSDLD